MNEHTVDPVVNFDSLKLTEQIERKEIELAAAVPTRENGTPLLSMGRFMRALINTVSMVPKLLRADRRSFWDAASKAAIDGLLPDGKEAALVPFEVNRKNDRGNWVKLLTVQYIPMIGGYRRLVREAGIDWQLRVVHQKDDFKHELGDNESIHHVPSNDDDPGPWTHVYAIAKRGTDVIARDVMNRAAVFRVRDRSEGWKSMMRIKDEGERAKSIAKSAWGQWEEEMALKTVAKRQVKVLPLSTDSFIYDLVRREEAADRGASIRPQIASTGSLSDKMRALADQREQEALAETDEDDDYVDIDDDGDVIDKETGEVTESAAPQTAADAPGTKASTSSSRLTGQPDVPGAPHSAEAAPTADTAPAATPDEPPAAGAGPALMLTVEQAKQLRKLHEILMGAQSQRGILKGVTNFLADQSWPEGSAAENAATILREAHYRRIRGEGSPAECDKVRDQVTRL